MAKKKIDAEKEKLRLKKRRICQEIKDC